MFEIDGEYENRIGKYTVLALEPPKMHVRYHDGKHAELNIAIQGRIWENILAERESGKGQSRSWGSAAHAVPFNAHHFIKVVSVPAVDEMMFSGWHERVVMVNNPIQASRVKPGDRIIYYAIETNGFFAVATITGESFKADPKEYFYTQEMEECDFFPIDVDVAVLSPDMGVSRNGVELEDYRDFERMLGRPETLFSISEDDFESLAEMLTELVDGEDDGLADDDLDEEDEE